jgi:penicillin V acylase-like amidase (Ntn superfamily)
MAAALVLLLPGSADACTRILWNDNSEAVLTSRSMDWEPTTSKPVLVASPRGIARVGSSVGTATIPLANAARWRAKYGSVAVTARDSGTADGMNEKGLAAHALWLNATDYGLRDVSKPAVQVGLWAQYMLDNAATVNEVVALAPGIQVTPIFLDGAVVPLSLAVEDSSGDSAILQYIDGKLIIHHGPQFRILANDPAYDEALALVDPDGYADLTRNDPLPGNTKSSDRFVRANFYLDFLRRTKPASLEAAKAGLMSVARNVSVPIGAPMDEPGTVDETDYRTLSDLTHRTYTFEPSRRLALLVTDLSKMDFRAGQPIRSLNPMDSQFNGNVTRRYLPVKKQK